MASGGGEEEDMLRIMVSTDNHLGYCEKDPVRGEDSFAAFEEVLRLSTERAVDMVLLGGDLFHENKPSRRTMRNAVQLLEKYALGDAAVSVEVLSDQGTNFPSGGGRVNYEHPYLSIGLPIFSIHGNHDDPTRDGNAEALAALDVLAATRLVNYFGRQDRADHIEVSPVLLQKGRTRVALYGLGNVRDERLNYSWKQDKVKFLRPAADEAEEADDDAEAHTRPQRGGERRASGAFFNILVLHQNRDLGRGTKNCVREDMIPKWMDLVVWGHEHECEIEPRESAFGRFLVSQPGSTVATSLVEGEARAKHCAVVTVLKGKFKLDKIPLTAVRTLLCDGIALRECEEFAEERPEDVGEAAIVEAISTRLEGLIDRAKEAAVEPRYPDSVFEIKAPDRPLIRLKVDHRGFPKLNPKKVAPAYVGRVANPEQILLFSRLVKKNAGTSKTTTGGGAARRRRANRDDDDDDDDENDADYDDDLDLEEDRMDKTQLAHLIKGRLEGLKGTKDSLKVLVEDRALEALEEFVDKADANAFNEVVDATLDDAHTELKKSNNAGFDDPDKFASQVHSRLAQRKEKLEAKAAKKHARHQKKQPDDDRDDDHDDDERGNQDDHRAKRQRPAFDDQDDDDDDDHDDRPAPKAAKKQKPTRPAPPSDDDDDDDESDQPPPKPKPATRRKPAPKAAPKSRKKRARDDDDDDDDEDDDDEPAPKPSAPARRA